jgi:acyl-CoA thioesterase
VLTVTGKAVHDGRSTKVIRVTITNQKEELLLDSTFTCFVIKPVEE